MTDSAGHGLKLHLERASWTRDGDGISFGGTSRGAPFTTLITRDGLATVVGKDRSELSATEAWQIFGQIGEMLVSIVLKELTKGPKSYILIGHDEVRPFR